MREIAVDGGTFTMGRGYCAEITQVAEWESDCACELLDAPHERTLEPFLVDATEVTWSAFAPDPACPTASLDCLGPGALLPVLTGRALAAEHCAAQGKSLPTEAQWELVASARGTRSYPWGEEAPTCERANFDLCRPEAPGERLTTPVGAYAPSEEGIFDLAGNAAELVLWEEPAPAGFSAPMLYCLTPYDYCPPPPGPSCYVDLDRGGDSLSAGDRLRSAHRSVAEYHPVGFRCVRTP